MIGCVKVKITPIGGISCKAESVGGINASARPVDGISVRAERVGRMDVNASRIGGIHCRVFRTCSPSIRVPYLEISPTIAWIVAGETQNDVFSNTYWNIH